MSSDYRKCNSCGGSNLTSIEAIEDYVPVEVSTKCSVCGFCDYWCCGEFESSNKSSRV